jgi:SAM-dependent methyltransferase
MHTLEAGSADEALVCLLGLSDPDRRRRFRRLMGGETPTYREALELLCDDAEGTWCLHRFTDPTFVTAESLIRALAQQRSPFRGRVLDLCGGTGHLTRVLQAQRAPGDSSVAGTVLADVGFWKLWLASRFTAPGVAAVCCDANNPLPFARGTFAAVFLADAFPYIWHKRMLAEEMMRLVGGDGLIVMPHLHSALGENHSAGDTLTPAAYRALFGSHHPRLFSDERLFDDVVERHVVDLTRDATPEELGTEASFTLVASPDSGLFRRYVVPPTADVTGALVVNPLYAVARSGGSTTLTLRFPTPEYEAEFAECRRYLPERITVEADLAPPILAESLGPEYAYLREHRVLIDAPIGY